MFIHIELNASFLEILLGSIYKNEFVHVFVSCKKKNKIRIIYL